MLSKTIAPLSLAPSPDEAPEDESRRVVIPEGRGRSDLRRAAANGAAANGHSNSSTPYGEADGDSHGTRNGHAVPNGASSTNGSPDSAMPTGIYSAMDTVRGPQPNRERTASKPPSYAEAHATRPTVTPNSEVPSDPHNIPRPGSIRMQVRFVRGLFYAASLFVRLLFWQVYVRRYLPGYVDATNLKRWIRWARGFRRFAISMGGVYIKLGQFISTRVDALPEEIVRELESLQDEVPTLPFKRIKRQVEQELGPIESRFLSFNEEPIAAASLGQAHRARLLSGERVVVKVLRPGIRQTCYTDLATLNIVARIAARFGFISRRADPVALGDEFGRVLLEELSYDHETHNGLRFYEMYRNDLGVYIPDIYSEHSTDRVLTLEDVTAIKINDYAALEAAGISRKEVAERLMDTYLKQIFEHFFFHADPHPGNLFVYPLPVPDPSLYLRQGGGRPFYLIFIDFGMTGTLTREIADGMVNTLAAVIARDPDKLINSYVKLGFVLPGADLTRIKQAAKAAFDEVWGMSMTEIRDMDYERATNLANEFGDLINSMPFYLPQDFIYLGRTVSILSGMSTSLDPNFNPWHELEPYAQRLAAAGFGVDVDLSTGELNGTSIIQSLFNGNGGQAIINVVKEVNRRTAPINPSMQILEALRSGEVHVVAEPSMAYKAQLRKLEYQDKRMTRALLFGTVLIASAVFYTGGEPALAGIGFAFCAGSVLYGVLRG